MGEIDGKMQLRSKMNKIIQLIKNREIKTGEVLCELSNMFFSARLLIPD